MINLFVKKPATTIMFVLFFVVLGVFSYFKLPNEIMPQIDFPFVTVRVIYPGATPLEMETQVIKKIEDALVEISEIKDIQSRAMESVGLIFIEFKLGTNPNVKAMEAKDKVDGIINSLPDKIKKPVVEKFNPMSQPIMNLVLSSKIHDGRTLFEFADKRLKNQFFTVSGVGGVDIYGGKQRQINIKLDPVLMKKYLISISDVIGALSMKNMNVPSGMIEKTYNSINVRFIGEFENLDEIRQMKLVSGDSSGLTLSQIATIEDTYKRVETIARYNGAETVSFGVKKISDGNAVNIGKEITKKLPELRKLLPEGMELNIASDKTTFIINENLDTIQNIIVGMILTILILYVFTGNPRLTLISSIVIPTSVISTLFLVDYSKFTINMMTLLAIATSLGTLIANAIVIIENIIVYLDRGKSPTEAAIEGTREVIVPVLAAAGTNIVVFVPIAFMGGIVGQFMKQFGLTVVYATIFSILGSFALTPMLCALFLKKLNPKIY